MTDVDGPTPMKSDGKGRVKKAGRREGETQPEMVELGEGEDRR